ncbi:hypothetical protein CPB85DRAFT_1252759 [Mucidula mucida]|nr:hypothetical protein CPB85DRAFT_1252759 [Mucidula mucida]
MHREGAAALKQMAGGWCMLAENLVLGVLSPVAVTKSFLSSKSVVPLFCAYRPGSPYGPQFLLMLHMVLVLVLASVSSVIAIVTTVVRVNIVVLVEVTIMNCAQWGTGSVGDNACNGETSSDGIEGDGGRLVHNRIHHPNFDDERAMATDNFSTITLKWKHCVLNDSLIIFQEGVDQVWYGIKEAFDWRFVIVVLGGVVSAMYEET